MKYLKDQLSTEYLALSEFVDVLEDKRNDELEKAVVTCLALFQHIQLPLEEVLALEKALLKHKQSSSMVCQCIPVDCIKRTSNMTLQSCWQ